MNDTKKYPKRILVHDLEQEDFQKQFPHLDENTLVLSKEKSITHCIGCFGCWIKTPGTCVLKDDFQNQGKNVSHAEELIVISKCTYGGFSPFVKNVVDRSIPSLLPFFSVRNKELHHTARAKHQLQLKIHFYENNISDDEKQTAINLVKANEINLIANKSEVHFYMSVSEIKGEDL
jgi:multimeric flavodoxin WrbA